MNHLKRAIADQDHWFEPSIVVLILRDEFKRWPGEAGKA
jgi:hypothetical protein